MTDEPPVDPESPREEIRADIAAEAVVQQDATWERSDKRRPHSALIGYITGEVGPKGDISAQHRELSRTQVQRVGDRGVPRGTTTPGTGRYVLAAVALMVLLLSLIVALIVWLLW